MTTHDIYSWIQMGLQVLIGGGLVAGIYRYFGMLKRAIESQEKTIAAQAEQMKAQSTVLQDFERHSKIMQQVIDFFAPQAQLQREQAYKARVERDMKEWEDEMRSFAEPILANIEDMTGVVHRLKALFDASIKRVELHELEVRHLHEEAKNRVQTDSSPSPELTAGGANGASDNQP